MCMGEVMGYKPMGRCEKWHNARTVQEYWGGCGGGWCWCARFGAVCSIPVCRYNHDCGNIRTQI